MIRQSLGVLLVLSLAGEMKDLQLLHLMHVQDDQLFHPWWWWRQWSRRGQCWKEQGRLFKLTKRAGWRNSGGDDSWQKWDIHCNGVVSVRIVRSILSAGTICCCCFIETRAIKLVVIGDYGMAEWRKCQCFSSFCWKQSSPRESVHIVYIPRDTIWWNSEVISVLCLLILSRLSHLDEAGHINTWIEGFLQKAPTINGSVITFVDTMGLVCSFNCRN